MNNNFLYCFMLALFYRHFFMPLFYHDNFDVLPQGQAKGLAPSFSREYEVGHYSLSFHDWRNNE